MHAYIHACMLVHTYDVYDVSCVQALECFLHVVPTPPAPRTAADVWLQVGHVYELQAQYEQAMEAYSKGTTENPNHAKLLQHIAWLRLLDSPFLRCASASSTHARVCARACVYLCVCMYTSLSLSLYIYM